MKKALALALTAASLPALSQVTQPTKSATSLSSSANPALQGTAVTFTASVTGGSLRPAGSVMFREGTTAIPGCEAVAVGASGEARCTVSTLTVGTHSINAVYGGSASYSASTSATLSQGIMAVAETKVVLSTTLRQSHQGQRLVFTLDVASPLGSPAGTANFYADDVPLADCMGVPFVAGFATCVNTSLAVGTHIVAGQYNGSATFAPSATAIVQVVRDRLRPRVDFDGDYKSDILWTNTDGRVAHWLMDGTRQADGWAMMSQASAWTPSLLGDFNGDGKTDILWRHVDGTTAMWLVDGKTQVGGARLMLAGSPWTAIALGDFNGDGKADIVWQMGDGSTAIWLMDGTTQIGGARLMTASPWRVRHVADFNGDGKSDILWEGPLGQLAIWFMDGATQVGGGVAYTPTIGDPNRWTPVFTGDIDGDGRADMVVFRADGSLGYWLMEGAIIRAGENLGVSHGVPVGLADIGNIGRAAIITQLGTSVLAIDPIASFQLQLVPPGAADRVVRLGDFNGDGRADVLMRRTDGSVVMVLTPGPGAVPAAVDIFGAGSTWSPAAFRD